MVERLGDRFEFWILTRDRDAKDAVPYPNVKINNWNQVGKAMVYYASPNAWSLATIRRLTQSLSPNVVYLNSYFSKLAIRFLLLRKAGMMPGIPVVLAPRGEFSPGALALKGLKKKIYLTIARNLNLYCSLIWQASSVMEEQDIRVVVGGNSETYIAPDITSQEYLCQIPFGEKPEKVAGKNRFVFLSRISRKKNLHRALEMLKRNSGQCTLDIYGPVADKKYWQECKEIIASMPDHIQVCYRGLLPHERVMETLHGYHFLLLPTMGENFGHVILEALAAGCPVLISDQTPWSNLASKQAGWDLPLDDSNLWQQTLQHCIDMDGATYSHLSQSACQFAQTWLSSSEVESKMVDLFTHTIGQSRHARR
jgi:glycosyltransferase involved in cell wall biosynthesis